MAFSSDSRYLATRNGKTLQKLLTDTDPENVLSGSRARTNLSLCFTQFWRQLHFDRQLSWLNLTISSSTANGWTWCKTQEPITRSNACLTTRLSDQDLWKIKTIYNTQETTTPFTTLQRTLCHLDSHCHRLCPKKCRTLSCENLWDQWSQKRVCFFSPHWKA